MPGILDESKPIAVFRPEWAVYRESVTEDDDPAAPEDVAETIDLRRNLSGVGGQIWVVPERVAGAGTCDITIVAENFGSLVVIQPFVVGEAKTGLDHLDEYRFVGLLAVPHRLLVTNITPGAEWKLHTTYLSLTAV